MKIMVRAGLTFLLATLASAAFAQGIIRGTVKTENGPAANVLVTLEGGSTERTTVTDTQGRFLFGDVAAGTYSAIFSAQGLTSHTEDDIQVQDGITVNLDIFLIANLNIMESMTVASASRRPERVVEAPAAVTVITEKELASQTTSGQLPRALETTPGVELAQAGVYDFNLNARGFNSSLNRRILVLVDGRETATGFLGNQEWSAISSSMDTFASMELVRGPGSALYGANAFNGVLNITSKRPVDDLGGVFSVGGGELSTRRADLRYAGEFGNGWSYRVNAGYFASSTWSESRTAADLPFEYDGLGSPEQVPLDEDDVTGNLAGLRFDKDFDSGSVLTMEAGWANIENALAVTGIGRVQITESERPWYRVNYNMENWNFMYTNSQRNTPQGQRSLGTGNLLWEDSEIQTLEIQGNYDLWDGRVQLVFGGSYTEEDIDTSDPNGNHTLMKEAKQEDMQALFGQAKIAVNEKLDVVLAGRWDDSSLHESQESPKAALVYKFNPNNSVRLTYNEAFQTANYSEYFLRAASANIIPFGAIQDGVVLGGFGLDLRNVGQDGQPLGPNNGPPLLDWQNIPVVAAGNPDLVPEQIESWEVGYKGIIGEKLFLTVDYYESTSTNFITDLLPGVNPNFTSFQIQENIPAPIADALRSTLNGALGPLAVGLTNQTVDSNPSGLSVTPDGHPVLVVSYTNAGEVDTNGLDVAFNYYVNDKWTIMGNYSWFDFEVIDQLVSDALTPNASENKWNLGVTYSADRLSAGLKLHVVEGFPWAAGVFVGQIPDYETINFNLQWDFAEQWEMGLDINNLADEEHYQIFGGSVNGRRALGTVRYRF